MASAVKTIAPGASADATKDVTEGGRYRRKPNVQVAPGVRRGPVPQVQSSWRSGACMYALLAQKHATLWRKSTRPRSAGARAALGVNLLGDRKHVTDLVHLPGFGAVSGVNEGAYNCAK